MANQFAVERKSNEQVNSEEDFKSPCLQFQPQNSAAVASISLKKVPQLKTKKLKLGARPAAARDFQDEFMSKYEEFSQSWRDEIDRNKRF